MQPDSQMPRVTESGILRNTILTSKALLDYFNIRKEISAIFVYHARIFGALFLVINQTDSDYVNHLKHLINLLSTRHSR